MQGAQKRCAMFCVAEIPPSTLDNFIGETVSYELEDCVFTPGFTTEDWFVLMTSKDLSTIHHGLLGPNAPFTSPFIDYTIEDVAEWFKDNISVPELVGYVGSIFIVLDTEAEESGICTIVDISEGTIQTLHCDFALALTNVCNLDTNQMMEEGIIGCFSRSGVAMTKDNIELALHSGMYLDGMEVKVDEEWKDFHKW